jgi:hypothetical protein
MEGTGICNILEIVATVCESRKPGSVEVDCKRLVGGAESVNSHVEFLASEKQGVSDVSLDNVGFSLRVLGVVAKVVLPLRDLLDFVEDENALALRLADRFHDPEGFWVVRLLFEFLVKDRVFRRQMEGHRKEVIPKS